MAMTVPQTDHPYLPHFASIVDAGVDRPWLTLVHGASQHSGLFSAQVDAFRDTYRLLLIDLPGHGKSADYLGPFGAVEYTQAVLAALNAANVTRTHFWGTHTGAAVGLLLAAQYPTRVASLVLEGPTLPGVEVPYVTATISRVRQTMREQGIEAARLEWFETCAWFDVIRTRPVECRAEAQRQLIAGFAGQPWVDTTTAAPVPPIRAMLQHIAVPALLINGEHDVEDFIRIADELESTLPHVERVTIAGAGGFPLWEFPVPVNALVKDFLAQQTM